ncbi:Tumor necrosis factor ligand superfamily member 10 [Camelus dromedarius]|uniref:Tumor necrosis factor ligand superfamily member 10 n=1 Tax=Camelus dromedarius TaxID=9838 RepID=A0A5N4EL27_CAMDR|nr:Tumor necrosis factor ligand superfamily member 10 [Camelus dromedarius]
MASVQAPGGASPGQTCVLMLIFTVLLQSLCVAITYVYFTNELKQIQDKYSKSGIGCFLKEDDSSWDPSDEESMINPCWQVKWQLRQFIRKAASTYLERKATEHSSLRKRKRSSEGSCSHNRDKSEKKHILSNK